jgi:hypothetical protein
MAEPQQLTAGEVARMTPEAISEALREGKLAALLRGENPAEPEPEPEPDLTLADLPSVEDDPTGQIGADELATMGPAEIADALSRGLLDDLLGRGRAA